MQTKPVIAAQVISEYLNVLKRLLKEPKLRLIEHCILVVEGCEIVPTNEQLLKNARHLIIKYDFQLFDALVVASALQSGCSVLYSEDLHHNLLVESRLTIINPFLSDIIIS